MCASYIQFSLLWISLTVGLMIAFVKGYLVAANFMHLNDEKSIIYMILGMTVVFFIVLFFMPTLWHNDKLKTSNRIPIQNGEIYKEVDTHHEVGH